MIFVVDAHHRNAILLDDTVENAEFLRKVIVERIVLGDRLDEYSKAKPSAYVEGKTMYTEVDLTNKKDRLTGSIAIHKELFTERYPANFKLKAMQDASTLERDHTYDVTKAIYLEE